MEGINQAMLMGTVGQDPEVKNLNNGSVVANFSIATNKYYKDQNGQKQQITEWHRIEAWNGNAQIVQQYVGKGKNLFVQGEIKTDSFQSNEGVQKYMTKIRAFKVTFIPDGSGNKPNAGQQAPAQGQQPAQQPQQQAPAQGQQPVENAQQQTDQYVTKEDFTNNTESDDELPF